MTKQCSKCNEIKSLSDFGPRKSTKDGLHIHCLECVATYMKEYRAKPDYKPRKHELAKIQHLKNPALKIYKSSKEKGKQRGYASIADYMTRGKFVEWYNNRDTTKCEACGTTENLVIDHCHETGRPRGILCEIDNFAEGLLKTIENAEKLIQYRNKHDLYKKK